MLLWSLGPAGVLARQRLLPGDDRAATVNALGFSGDGQYLATGDADGHALVWKRGVTDKPWIGAPGASPLKHASAIRDINFHPTEPALLATASDDRSARVWTLDLDNRRLMPNTGGQKGLYTLAHDRAVLGARFVRRADDPTALMTRSDKRVFFWSNETTHDARTHNDWVTDVNTSKDGELIVTASADGTAHLWSSRAATSVASLRGHRNEMSKAFFSPRGDVVITASRDRTLRQWRITRPVLLTAGRQWQLAAAIDPPGRRAVLCGEASQAAPNPCRIAPLSDLSGRGQNPNELLEAVATDTVGQVSFSQDGALVLGVAGSRVIYQNTWPVLWDASTRKRLRPPWLDTWQWAAFNRGQAELVTVRTLPDNGNGSGGSELAVWPQQALSGAGAATAKPLFITRLAQAQAGPADLSADGRWLAGIRGEQVLLWDRNAPAAPPRALIGHLGDVRSLAFSADSQVLVTASSDRTARVWPLAAPLTGGQPAAGASTRAGAGAGAGDSNAPVATVLRGGHGAALTSAAFSPDGSQVVTGSTDNSLRLWDARSGRELAAINRHADAVNAAMFGPDGKTLLSASDDGTARLDGCTFCSLPLADLQARARELVRLIEPLEDEDRVRLRLLMLPRWLGGAP